MSDDVKNFVYAIWISAILCTILIISLIAIENRLMDSRPRNAFDEVRELIDPYID